MMKRIVGILIVALAVTLVAPSLLAQTEERGEVGIFADYTRLHHLNGANFWGVGGSAGFNVNKNLQFEGSMAYDFERTYTNTYSGTFGKTTTITTTRSNGLRLLNGLFGPKIQTGVGPVRAFAVLKGGFLNFSVNAQNAPAGFTSQVGNVTSGDTNGVFYPGGGVEFFAKWFGVRAEVGDLMYFDNGANHNLKFTVGPVFRF